MVHVNWTCNGNWTSEMLHQIGRLRNIFKIRDMVGLNLQPDGNFQTIRFDFDSLSEALLMNSCIHSVKDKYPQFFGV